MKNIFNLRINVKLANDYDRKMKKTSVEAKLRFLNLILRTNNAKLSAVRRNPKKKPAL